MKTIGLDTNAASQFSQITFLAAAREGNLGKRSYAVWAEQMFWLSCAFKGLMTKGIEYAFQYPVNIQALEILTENLYEELGAGISQKAHLRQLIALIQTLGGTVGAEPLPSTQICIEAHKKLGEAGLVSALAGVLANEICCQIEFQAIRQGVQGLQVPASVLTYFDLNLVADTEHAKDTRLVLEAYLPGAERTIEEATITSVGALTGFYNGVWDRVRPC